jgi:hypothetical protein
MTTRRDFLKLGALWLPALAAPRVAYSFLRAKPEKEITFSLDPGGISQMAVTYWVVKDGMYRVVYEGHGAPTFKIGEQGPYLVSVRQNMSRVAG